MKRKGKIISIILSLIVICIYFTYSSYELIDKDISKIYNIYLSGDIIGAVSDKDALYDLIDEKQQVIKDKYNVTNVYPPNDLEIVETYAYDREVSNLEEIYNKIEETQDFTIMGYEIKVFNDTGEKFTINVLDKNVFKEALDMFILAFVDEEDYLDYINNNQDESEEYGLIYTNMDFIEVITIKETFISVNDKIYENSSELVQDLLFGFNFEKRNYTVKEGDTIESIAEDFELNPQEILIANSRYSSVDSLLTIGDEILIAYVIPEISFSYTVNETSREEYDYDNEIVRDDTKPSSYSQITTAGVTGISKITREYTSVNGELASSVEIKYDEVIREKVNQVTTKGKKVSYSWGWEVFQDTGTGWTWPTEDRYVVTSAFGYRELGGGKKHNGIDISGTGWGSKIFAANDGVVTYVYNGCSNNGSYPNSCGSGYGNQIVISHGNNVYTIYAHLLNSILVRVGQSVSRGQLIGYMGNSGQSTGTHLHFGVSTGDPRNGGTFYNPRNLYR